MNQETIYQYNVRVYAEDVDYMGIVYHANYLRYFERARTEMLRQNNLALSDLLKLDTLFAISRVNIHYLAPARLDDLLTITTTMHQSGACSFIFEHEMKNQQDKIMSKAQIKVVCVDGNLKPKRFPK
ncbi:YbgC/FadM family acyl-CoA thioesterase [Legionella drancourtii]|uniref:Esterase n=1 Tax=Legionella drancourtii LLAP12 TaxID=658187 RepID=G9ERH1_9GAMM|nr:YbgC/FadM family acyl-CoA thioesterase [Legionella drancourtii]EHL30140.1 esterase [Legionella drancourtii LLAP12]